MHPISHLLLGWTLANTLELSKRDRMLVTLAGVIPDMDGLGVLVDLATEGTAHATDLYGTYHHVLAHNLGFGLCLTVIAAFLAKRRFTTTVLVALSFHLHLLGDLVGSRGPDGYQWPIPYLRPFSDAWEWSWHHQWGLKAWPNVTITLLLLGLTLYWAWKRQRSPLELVSAKADAALARTLRIRFGEPSLA